MELVPLGPEFGVEARGIGVIDVASSDAAYRSIRAALEENSVLLFREQEVTDDVQAAFSRAFGPLERVKIGSVGAGTFYSRLHNIAADGTLVLCRGGQVDVDNGGISAGLLRVLLQHSELWLLSRRRLLSSAHGPDR
jgi:hypothetical protein